MTRSQYPPRDPRPERAPRSPVKPGAGGPWSASPRPEPSSRPPREPRDPREGVAAETRLGPIVITPVRVALVVALVGSFAYLFFALSVRETAQLPLLSSGAAVLGIAFMGLAVAGFFGIREAGYEGRNGRAFGLAVLGGLSAIVAFGCFAAAIVLGLEA